MKLKRENLVIVIIVLIIGGIDLCGCGSGEKVGECEESFDECKNNIASQIKFQQNKSIIEVIKERGHF